MDSSISDRKFSDYMGCKNNAEIQAALDTAKGERVVFSCVVIKFNRWGMKQERTFLLTNQNLFNIKRAEVQRRIALASVKAVTKSTVNGNAQFIVHIKNEYDYMFESEFRKEIFEALKWAYWMIHQTNMPVYGVSDRLKDYATTKKDISNGIAIQPKEDYRLSQEDIYKEDSSSNSTYASSTNSTARSSSNHSDEISAFNDEVSQSVAVAMYSRQKHDVHATLNDFIIKSVIGRGSFGKVFLV